MLLITVHGMTNMHHQDKAKNAPSHTLLAVTTQLGNTCPRRTHAHSSHLQSPPLTCPTKRQSPLQIRGNRSCRQREGPDRKRCDN